MMNQDQLQRLLDLTEKVAEAVLIDCDPENWSGFGVAPKEMDKETRGNSKWDRGIAAQSLAVLTRLVQITGHNEGSATPPGEDGDEMTPHEAEAAAVALLDRVQARRGR